MKTSDLLMVALTMHGPPTTPDQAASLRQIERLARNLADEEAKRLRQAGVDALGNDLEPSARRGKINNYVLKEL